MYGFTVEDFLAALASADVRVLLDVRQRRGVRGSEYAWANAKRLQAALADAGVEYRHLPELAPTTELRRLQYAEDDRQGVGKRSRTELAPAYRERYLTEILDGADLRALAASLPQQGAAALFCVERDPEACHRSLVAERLSAQHGIEVTHLLPLSPRLRERVQAEYAPEDRAAAEQALLTYQAPGDQGGGNRVRHAMLNGAKGDLAELRILAEAAVRDYRDVLYWTGS